MAAKIKDRYKNIDTRLRHKPRGIKAHTFERVYWPYLPLVLFISLMIGLAGKSGNLGHVISHPAGSVLSYTADLSRQTLLNDTNTYRVQQNLPDLSLNSQLDAAATAKAKDMVKRDYWSHNTPDGKSPWTFVVASGYDYQRLGENLASGFGDASSIMKAWYASAPHRSNMLNPSFDEVGFGYANDKNFTAAGGGPMTVVVAYYGQSGHHETSLSVIGNNPDDSALTASPGVLARQTSRLELALATSPLAPIATSLALVILIGTIILWASRHLLAFRRALMTSEKFVITHPLFDLGLLAVAVLSYVLSQTAGLIQ